jgi:general L-amino acid transport system substrate-binding protein
MRHRVGFALARAAVLACVTLLSGGGAAGAGTLQDIKERGHLNCGVSQGLAGFSAPQQNGEWTGFDVDFCRALAAAILDDARKVKFVPLTASERFPALQSATIDVLSRNSTWNLDREGGLGIVFAGVTYYDGQGFMVRRARNAGSALDLGGSKVCVQTGTTTEQNLADYFAANGMKYELVAAATVDELVKSYDGGACDVLTSDASQLYALRLKLAKPGEHVILPDVISKEPLGPAVRRSDMAWFTVVKWVHFAMVNAEELGVSSKTLEAALASNKPYVRRLLGVEGNLGEQIGLSKDWVVRIVRQVGNYGEVFERNVGTRTPLGIPRGINQLWNAGGIMYAPPVL